MKSSPGLTTIAYSGFLTAGKWTIRGVLVRGRFLAALLLLSLLPGMAASCNTSTGKEPNVSGAGPDSESTPERLKARTIVTTDGEIDDVDSFIRMLLYANEFELEGLVYSSSMWHYKGDGKGTRFTSEMEMTRERYGERTALRWPGTLWIQELIGAYARVYPKLRQHAAGYPRAEALMDLVKVGNIDFEGAMARDTEGSDWIRAKLLDGRQDPIYLQVWGGTNTIARALKSIEEEYRNTPQWDSIYARVSKKAIIYTIMDQDATYRNYIGPKWPDIRVFYNSNQFWCFAYPWKQQVPEAWHPYLEGDFIETHIIRGHGPLLERYYSYGDGQQQAGDPEHRHGDLDVFNSLPQAKAWGGPFGPFDFISEGDSPSYLHLVDVGLGNLENPSFGGWGGRLVPSDSAPNRWEDGTAAMDYNPFRGAPDATYPQTRWVPAIQKDFAARADWCISEYENANHPPKVQLRHPGVLAVQPGESVVLEVVATDPDGDPLQFSWWHYAEADSYLGTLDMADASAAGLSLSVPEDLKPGESIHLVAEVTDKAEHSMTRYARVILQYR